MSEFMAIGNQEVDMSVYAKVAAHEAVRQEGVVRLNAGFTEKLGMSRTPGVTARIEEDGSLQLDISIVVRYGTDLRTIGPAIQESVLNAIRKMSDQPVGQINIYIADIDFPKGAAKTLEEGEPS
ncbi:MAG TPA: Asp23/Gls24 family envelope stress response protein [Candidatus Hydrogenedentes bacterium]|nr:Asp23/Gls24 family envelope stress response protein [Candidatus Hydrogenedentota bacterium]HOS03675.1 Asp23/Gls24 family envelope stress response protein [Candidatus Hydrogenedentota bacterium]